MGRVCSSSARWSRRSCERSQTLPHFLWQARSCDRSTFPRPGRQSDAPDARPIDPRRPPPYVGAMTGTLMVGVSGVRGIVDRDLTPEVVTRWAAAFGTWVREAGRPSVIVGRDSRKSGPRFTAAVIAGLGGAGCRVIDVGLAPTPTIQLAVLHHGAGGGIAITASHNPIEWNALKFIGPDGIFLDGADGARVLELVGEDGGGGGRTGKVTTDEGAVERHLDAVLKLPAVRSEERRVGKECRSRW